LRLTEFVNFKPGKSNFSCQHKLILALIYRICTALSIR